MAIENRKCVTPCSRKYIWYDEPFDSVELHWSIVIPVSFLSLPRISFCLSPTCGNVFCSISTPPCTFRPLILLSTAVLQRQHPATFLRFCAGVDGHDDSLDIALANTLSDTCEPTYSLNICCFGHIRTADLSTNLGTLHQLGRRRTLDTTPLPRFWCHIPALHSTPPPVAATHHNPHSSLRPRPAVASIANLSRARSDYRVV